MFFLCFTGYYILVKIYSPFINLGNTLCVISTILISIWPVEKHFPKDLP